MTVSELRQKLATLPDDMVVAHEYDTFWTVDDVRVNVVDVPDHEFGYGDHPRSIAITTRPYVTIQPVATSCLYAARAVS